MLIVFCRWLPNGEGLSLIREAGQLEIVVQGNSRNADIDGNWLEWNHEATRFAVVNGKRISIWSGGNLTRVDTRSFPDSITDISWSPDNRFMAIGFESGAIEIVDADSLSTVMLCAMRHDGSVILDWHQELGLVSASDSHLCIWSSTDSVALGAVDHAPSDKELEELEVLEARSADLDFDNWDEQFLAADMPMARTAVAVSNPHDHFAVTSMLILNSGDIVTAGNDATIRVWDRKGKPSSIFESPEAAVFVGLSILSPGGLIAALEDSGEVRLIDVPSRSIVSSLSTGRKYLDDTGYAGICPGTYTLGMIGVGRDRVDFYDLTENLKVHSESNNVHYRNAKVVLVGDSGVGKSGLALALRGQDFQPTESTHGRHVWSLTADRIASVADGTETREVLLWDLAGQPGYRLFHRLSLRDVAVGIIVFDSRSENDPFRGVWYWARALDEAAQSSPLIKVLVSARCDRGGISVSSERIQTVLDRYQIDAFFETSAKTGAQINEMLCFISSFISWETLPVVTAPDLFLEIRRFLIVEKEAGLLLAGVDELQERFQQLSKSGSVSKEIFEVCLGRLDAAGLVTRISLGNLWLLQPELLDSYVAWLAQAARQEPDGLGAISEHRALRGEYEHEIRTGAADEQAMLVTAIEEVVGRGLALRIGTDRGEMLVFPSELKTTLPDYPQGYRLEVAFKFDGPVAAVYATVAVRLVNSMGFGTNYRLYKNAAIFDADSEELCGFAAHYLSDEDEARGRIVVFFGAYTTAEKKLAFLRYIDFQLKTLALAGSLVRERIYICYECDYKIPNEVVSKRVQYGLGVIRCPVCDTELAMDDILESLVVQDRRTSALERRATHEQARQSRLAGYGLRRESSQYDVFLCHNSLDLDIVRELNRLLRDEGVVTWLDVDEIIPGDTHVRQVEAIIARIPCAIVALGPNSLGPWQEQEYYALLQRRARNSGGGPELRVIPVLLPGSQSLTGAPPFLSTYSVVDMRGPSRLTKNIKNLVAAVLSPIRVQ